MIRMLTLAALAAVAASPMALAQAQPGAAPAVRPGAVPAAGNAATGAGRAAVNDSLFAAAAASAGMAEVSLSELGLQKATDGELKRFSQQMVAEHNRMNSELMTTAQQMGLRLPTTPDVRAQFCAQSLAGLSGEEFDRCYAKAQLVAHMDSMAMFEAEAERGQNPAVKALAARGVTHIREHLRTIRPIAMRYMMEDKEHSGAAPTRGGAGAASDRGAAGAASDRGGAGAASDRGGAGAAGAAGAASDRNDR